jgi:hypothetical protein
VSGNERSHFAPATSIELFVVVLWNFPVHLIKTSINQECQGMLVSRAGLEPATLCLKVNPSIYFQLFWIVNKYSSFLRVSTTWYNYSQSETVVVFRKKSHGLCHNLRHTAMHFLNGPTGHSLTDLRFSRGAIDMVTTRNLATQWATAAASSC